MNKYDKAATGNTDHAENFIDLDDLDLAGVELTSWEVVAGGTLSAGCGGCGPNIPTTSLTCYPPQY